jgi:hypothetical protein
MNTILTKLKEENGKLVAMVENVQGYKTDSDGGSHKKKRKVVSASEVSPCDELVQS